MCFMRGVRACLMHLSVRSLASPAGPADRFCNLLLTISYKKQQNMCMWRKASLSLCMAACCPHVFDNELLQQQQRLNVLFLLKRIQIKTQ